VATAVDVTGDVTISNAGVTAIGAGKVTEAMLSTATQDRIPTCTITVGTENVNVITTTIQVKDAGGNDLAGRFYIRVSLNAAADGTTLGTAPSGAVTATAGAIKRSVTAKTDLEVVTNTAGTFTFTAEEAGALTLYCSADLNGYQIMGSQAMVWGA
jgi:hypothetical protein